MNTNRIIELCLVFLVTVLSFSIGTFVGKKYSDNQHKLALLDPNYKHESISDETSARTVASTETKNTKVTEVSSNVAATTISENNEENSSIKSAITNSTPITDSDVAKMAQEFSDESDTKTLSKNESAKSESTNLVKTINEDGTNADDSAAVAAASSNAVSSKKNVSNLPRKVAAISEKTKSTGNQYTVQVGAYPSPSEAEKISSSLQARGYKASNVTANVNGKTWYRVQVGLFNSFDEAQTYKKELVEQNHLSSAIIQKLSK